jgi:hypothetical protein
MFTKIKALHPDQNFNDDNSECDSDDDSGNDTEKD